MSDLAVAVCGACNGSGWDDLFGAPCGECGADLATEEAVEEAKANRAGAKVTVTVNPGGDYRQSIEVKVRWDESGTKLERA